MGRINAVSSGVGFEGLSQLNRDLRAIGPEAQKELKETNIAVAKTEGGRAQSAALSVGGVAAHVAPSVKGGGSTTWAGVKFGGAAYPMAMGAEFGGQGRPTTQQFQPWRGSGGDAGYFVYPTIRRDADQIREGYASSVDKIMERHNL
jgi:hypothetical protein